MIVSVEFEQEPSIIDPIGMHIVLTVDEDTNSDHPLYVSSLRWTGEVPPTECDEYYEYGGSGGQYQVGPLYRWCPIQDTRPSMRLSYSVYGYDENDSIQGFSTTTRPNSAIDLEDKQEYSEVVFTSNDVQITVDLSFIYSVE